MSNPDGTSTPVFVSYSHRDKKWLERLQVHLKPLARAGNIDLWDDTRILPVILAHCLFTDSPLGRFQAINAPDKPLEQLTKAGRDKALSDLARTIAAGLSGEAAGDAPVPTPTRPRTASGPAVQTKGPDGAQVHSPRGSPENGQSAQQSLGTWIFGGLLLAFLFAVSPSPRIHSPGTSTASWRSAPPCWPGCSAGSSVERSDCASRA